ncbi:MAG: sigma-70 family RNA polymerase sigma factor [Planctomycetes bacterium]|nr:sigma-70 family RNA polymerase sigma factor [Planctomycetota bacterium]
MELVHEFKSGRREALHELYQRYEERLRRILRIEMGSFLRRFDTVDDLMSAVYLVAERKLQEIELQDHASILLWLRAIARNQVRDRVSYWKADRRDRRREVPLDSTQIEPPGRKPQETPSEITVHAEFMELIDSYLERLDPPDYREVILLKDYYEGDWEFVRQRLGRSTVEAAMELYRRAHMKLRRRMDKHLRGAE